MDVLQFLIRQLSAGKSVSTDTRTLEPGALFFALKGDNFDGNKYAEKALMLGAAFAVVDDINVLKDDRYLLVEDVLDTLQELGREWRRQFDIPVIGITGTNGKTTTKELMTAVLSTKYRVLSTRGNLNNHIGVPLSLLQLREDHDIAVIEMGASGPGEIALLAKLAEPTATLVTNVGLAHIEGFGSVETIMETKAQLYDYIEENGGLQFVPPCLANEPFIIAKEYSCRVDYAAEDMKGKEIKKVKLKGDYPFVSLELILKSGEFIDINSKLFGSYNFDNLVSVLKVADHFDVSPSDCKKGIEAYQPSNNRSQLIKDVLSNEIVLDAYNSNPSSIRVALDHFLSLSDDRSKILILGDMLELGEVSGTEHKKLLIELNTYPALKCLLVGREFIRGAQMLDIKTSKNILLFNDSNEASEWWNKAKISHSLVLVKGSRGIALEKIFQ